MKYLLANLLLLFAITSSAQYIVSGGTAPPYEYTDGLGGTGIEKIYLLNTFSGASISYTSDAAVVRFYKYTHSIDDKVLIPYSEISTSNSGNKTTYTITNLQDSRGYFAEINGKANPVIWIIDYSQHLPVLNSIEPDRSAEIEDQCTSLKLLIEKSDDLHYYTTTGGKYSIIRKYVIEYPDLDRSNKEFTPMVEEIGPIDFGTYRTIDPPLTDTKFKISGDQFAKHFGLNIYKESTAYIAIATKAFIVAEQVSATAPSGITTELGGSAPAEINFFGYANEPTAHFYTWFIYNTSDLQNPIVRYTDRNIRYTFNESGNYKVVLESVSRGSSCLTSTSVEFSISTSSLEIPPNYFSPDANSETAKVFRIGEYKSLIKFKCSIFNRWGNKIYEWTDPSKGWDGKYKGKYVNTGVYFWVIDALGSDNERYQKAGDVNVIRKK
ncbi:gliding motility-associated-like protein [Dysgonomonas alginatilytica]|uniref:Gliding motility-associated-like protein n=1 Tax=Dysgonomonas alginatilytica TaxID=1605892 RepID=A0A2V3PPQ7_9BACT|nr:gliding motility-associated C-terminal domain-containing protein [Dysgonomonas alginatilytica]PXV63541.1 gliding motility-associated-like protein [Dysgonomonas alginatilytica]